MTAISKLICCGKPQNVDAGETIATRMPNAGAAAGSCRPVPPHLQALAERTGAVGRSGVSGATFVTAFSTPAISLTFDEKITQWAQQPAPGEVRQLAAANLKAARDDKAPWLTLRNLNLTSLPDCLAELTSATAINLAGNCLAVVPELPATLEELNVESNYGVRLPALPPALTILRIHGCGYSQLPDLPQELQVLSAGANRLKKLPSLPPRLTELKLPGNRLECLPKLPDTLEYLDVNGNCLTGLPRIPQSVRTLHCSFNPLSQFPDLPPSLVELDAAEVHVRHVPPSWPSSLRRLNLRLIDLGFKNETTFPPGLTHLNVADNFLAGLPPLPKSLVSLVINGNLLRDLPDLPSGLSRLQAEKSLVKRTTARIKDRIATITKVESPDQQAPTAATAGAIEAGAKAAQILPEPAPLAVSLNDLPAELIREIAALLADGAGDAIRLSAMNKFLHQNSGEAAVKDEVAHLQKQLEILNKNHI